MKTSAKSALDLSAKKKALLQKMLKQAGGNASNPSLPAHPQEHPDDRTGARMPACSFEQHRQWFHAQLTPSQAPETQMLALRLKGLVDYGGIQQTVHKLLHRHPILRASFPNNDGLMVYNLVPAEAIDIVVIDMSHTTASDQAFIALLEHHGQPPFDVGKGPLCRVSLFHTTDAHIVLFALHALIADHATLGILQQDFIALYDHLIGATTLAVPDVAHTYADYVQWQHQYIHSSTFQTHLAYWQQALSDAVFELNLPQDTTHHPQECDPTASHSIMIPSKVIDQLATFCQASDLDSEQVFLSALYLLLYRYTHQSDMVVGYLSENRATSARHYMTGPCANTIMLRMTLTDSLDGITLLSHVGDTLAATQPYAEVPFGLVVEHVCPTHDLTQSPLYQVFFAYYNDVQYGHSGVSNRANRLSIPPVLHSAPQTVGFIFHITEHGVTLTCPYDNTRFTRLSIIRFQQHYLSLLQALLQQPEQTITTYSFRVPNEVGSAITPSDRPCPFDHNATVVSGTPSMSASIPTSKPPSTSAAFLHVHQRIEQYAAQNPDAPAIVDSTTHLTYQELNTRANQLAHYLMTKGIGSEVLVGVCIKRSPMLIVCLLAILKTGGTYLPLDPTYPTERIHMILEDAQAALLLTYGHHIECSARWDGSIVDLVQLASILSTRCSENPSCGLVDHQRAYVIYTSGSTGKPKGVAIEHHSLLNLISWHQAAFAVSDHDRATLIAAPSFDASVWEIWPYLSRGACLYIPDETLRTMPEQLRDWLVEQDITCCFVPTPLAEQLLDLPWPQSTALRYMLTGGDRLHRYPSTDMPFMLVNNYGPTECTVVTTSGAISGTHQETHLPTIGHPIANTQAHILDQYGTEVPIGVVGELHIGGVGVARGYLNRPALTATCFVPNPFSSTHHQQHARSYPSSSGPGSRLYRTGDLVRWSAGEVIEFVGRIDDQVKVRGFRIELGEIEATLSHHPHVKACVVLVYKDTTDATKLVAYVVPQQSEQVPETVCSDDSGSADSLASSEFISSLRQHLSSQLPFYMIPALFIILNMLPMTPHGKVDRRALPPPHSMRPDHTACALETTTEELLADLWSKILQINKCGRADHFFELGGDSLRATQLLAQIQAHYSIQLTQRDLFAAPTIAQLADLIDQQDASSALTPPLGRRVYDDIIPLSFAQQRLWFLDQLEPGNVAYNIPLAISITGPLNRLALYQAMREIICRHETLRTTFQVQHGKPRQVIHTTPAVALKIIELKGAPATTPDAIIRAKIEEEIHHPFHLACGPLLRMLLLQTQPQVHIFVITLHHIISDGWSVGVLVQELNALYNAFVQHLPAPLPVLPIQYADFAYWQQESLCGIHLHDQQSYWVQQLYDAPPYLNLPTDYPRPPVQSFEGTSCLFQMSQEFSQQLRTFSKQEGVTLFMTLLAALGIVLTRICEQDEIVVAAPIANRTHHEVTNLIGFFVNTLALRVALSGDLDGHTLLAQVHTTTLESYNHQDIPFIQVVEALKPPRDTSRSPFSQVFLTLQNVPIPDVQLKDLSVQPINLVTEKTKADLAFTFLEHEEGLQLEIQYSTQLFSIRTIKRLQHQYQATLQYLVNYPEWQISHLWMQVSDTIQRTYE